MASYTGHGHHIPGTPVKTQPKQRKICGGIDYCPDCQRDFIRVFDGSQMLFSNPAGVIPKKASPLMTEPTPEVIADGEKHINVFNKAVDALREIGHDVQTAEAAVVQLLKSGIVLRDVNQADHVVDEAAPVLEAVEPTLAPEVESVQHVVDTVTADTAKVSAEAQAFIDEPNPPKPTA